MEDDRLYFTKLNTVVYMAKGVKHEVPINVFLNELSSSIDRNISGYSVSYDKNYGYSIFYNYELYDVYYGNKELSKKSERKDLVDKLDGLVIKSREVKNSINEKKEKENSLIENGDNGIFYTENDKIEYIKCLKERLKKRSIFDNATYGLDEYDIVGSQYFAIPLFFINLACLMVSSLLHIDAIFMPSIGLAVLDGIIAGTSITISDDEYCFSTISGLLALITRPLKWGKNVIKNVLSKSKERRKISLLEKTVKHTKLIETEKKEIEEHEEEKPLKTEVSKSIKLGNSKLLRINDIDRKLEYASKLLDILTMFEEAKNSDDYNKDYSEILDIVTKLNVDMDNVLKNEQEMKGQLQEYETVKQEIQKAGKSSARR